ncbi:MAG: cupin domain-containing protein [Candidatus Krumholzibacteria bacterium]|nr:cupin domain-containing protein [Candidatus Krumholzibacteria bacterium]
MKESFEVFVNSNDMSWQKASEYSEGTLVKVLRDNDGRKTVLLKLPPDFKMLEHTHTCIEQHFVLEGQYEMGKREFGQGSYQMIPPGVTHGPFTSAKGATILIIWDPL